MTEWTETQVTTKVSPRSVTATVSRLTGIIHAKRRRGRGRITAIRARAPQAPADPVPGTQGRTVS